MTTIKQRWAIQHKPTSMFISLSDEIGPVLVPEEEDILSYGSKEKTDNFLKDLIKYDSEDGFIYMEGSEMDLVNIQDLEVVPV